MDRVKDYISFVAWFVGLSYIALWPTAVPEAIAIWFVPPARLGCGSLAFATLQEFCRGREALVLSPGLQLVGLLAAFWVSVRLVLLVSVRLCGPLLSSVLRRVPFRLDRTFWRRLTRRRRPAKPPRYVPPRRHFGLRDTLH